VGVQCTEPFPVITWAQYTGMAVSRQKSLTVGKCRADAGQKLRIAGRGVYPRNIGNGYRVDCHIRSKLFAEGGTIPCKTIERS
jgi:hypothetical protein